MIEGINGEVIGEITDGIVVVVTSKEEDEIMGTGEVADLETGGDSRPEWFVTGESGSTQHVSVAPTHHLFSHLKSDPPRRSANVAPSWYEVS